ncbi:hypothetical protein BX286_2389 [Streptomyces sp. 3211.6]|nr:hypothetical protein BX286_2389 [Streptomyces sp. 3211.6]RPF40322.1 hypothetical protein EDD96_4077 [Streptomyces sp. Ag109_G2-6]
MQFDQLFTDRLAAVGATPVLRAWTMAVTCLAALRLPALSLVPRSGSVPSRRAVPQPVPAA